MHNSWFFYGIIFALSTCSIFSQDFPSIPDFIKFPPQKKERGNTSIWSSIKPKDNLKIYLLEDFESRLPWRIKPKRANACLHRFVFKNPITEAGSSEDNNTRKSYEFDLDKLRNSANIHRDREIRKQNSSYELRCDFGSPGKDFIVFSPSAHSLRNYKIHGMPRLFALWVKGNKKKHKLYALFSSLTNKSFPVYMGDLNFVGWQRLEQIIPSHLARRNRL